MGEDKVRELIQVDFEKVNLLGKHKTFFLLVTLLYNYYY